MVVNAFFEGRRRRCLSPCDRLSACLSSLLHTRPQRLSERQTLAFRGVIYPHLNTSPRVVMLLSWGRVLTRRYLNILPPSNICFPSLVSGLARDPLGLRELLLRAGFVAER